MQTERSTVAGPCAVAIAWAGMDGDEMRVQLVGAGIEVEADQSRWRRYALVEHECAPLLRHLEA